MRKYFILLFIIGMCRLPVMALPPLLVVSPEMKITDLVDYARFFVADRDELAPEDVLPLFLRGEFIEATGSSPAFGFAPGRDIWVALRMQSLGRAYDVVIEIGSPRIQRVDWFVIKDEIPAEPTLRQPGGEFRHPRVVLSVAPDQETFVFARVRSDTSILLPMIASLPADYAVWLERQSLWQFMHLGFLFSVSLIAGLVGLVQRKHLYTLLSGMCLLFLIHDVAYHHYQKLFGLPSMDWLNMQVVNMTGLGYALLMQLFTLKCIGYARMHRTSRMLVVAISSVMALIIVSIPLLPHPVATKLVFLLVSVGYVTGTLVSAREMVRQENNAVRLVFAAWAIASVTVGLAVLQWLAWVPVFLSPSILLRMMNPPMVMLFILAIHDHQQAEREQEKLLMESQRQTSDAQLKALRYQLNPHFLYNSLNAISGLSIEAPARIPHVVQRLATFLRLRLRSTGTVITTFANELEIAQAYLEIEQIRMEERLLVIFDIGYGLNDIQVPELILQPLLENAIQHGSELDGALQIRMRAACKEDELHVTIENTGSLAPGRGGQFVREEGIGLTNIRDRLDHVYGGKAGFDISEQDGWVVAKLVLPGQQF